MPSGHADISSASPCAKAPPAPSLQEGLAQGVCRVNSLSTNLLRCRPTPPAPTFFIGRATGAPIRCLDRHRPHFTLLRLLPELALSRTMLAQDAGVGCPVGWQF